MNNSYHNTNQLQGEQLANAERSAKTQEQVIMEYFTANGGKHTPEQLQRLAGLTRCPITSIRRSISNLTKSGKLIKLNEMATGDWGKPVHLWQLRSKQLTIFCIKL